MAIIVCRGRVPCRATQLERGRIDLATLRLEGPEVASVRPDNTIEHGNEIAFGYDIGNVISGNALRDPAK